MKDKFKLTFCNLCSADEEDELKRVNCIHNVSNEVQAGHHSNDYVKIIGAWIVPKAIKWPNDHSCEVHQHCQHIAHRQDFVEGRREERQQAADGKNDDEEGKNEADGVDGNAPLEPREDRVKGEVQTDEDDAGHKGL